MDLKKINLFKKMNTFIKKMIEQYKQSIINTTSEVNMEWIERIRKKYFYEDHNDLLPIPVFLNTAPKNTIYFLIHIILPMGKYHTELDALCNQSFSQSFVNAKLIGDKTDIKSLKEYSRILTRKYIEEQVVYYPNSMSRTETYIVMAKGIFDDIIINNAIHINELPPVTMSEVRNEKSEENKKIGKISRNYN